ncbi:hypothetical protein [Streptomyces prunicolor]
MSALMFLAGLTPLGAVCLAVTLFSGSLVPFFLLVDADFTAVSRWRDAVRAVLARWVREALLNAAALVLLLTTSPKGAMA